MGRWEINKTPNSALRILLPYAHSHKLCCSIKRQLWQYGKKLESCLLPLEVDRKLKAVDPFSTKHSRIRLQVASVSVTVTVALCNSLQF